MILRPTVPADLAAVVAEPIPWRIRCLTGIVDGQVVGIGGYGYLPCGTVCGFLQVRPQARLYPVALHKGALAVLADARKRGVKQIVALADPTIASAPRWLERLGFTAVDIAPGLPAVREWLLARGADAEAMQAYLWRA